MKKPHTLAGMVLALFALACFATLDTITQYVNSVLAVPVLMGLWVRYAFQAISTTVVMLPLRGTSLLHTKQPKLQFLRGALLLFCSMSAFYSLSHMPVGEFTAIAMITPLVVTLLAATTLGERVSLLRWLLVIGGFVGTLIIIRPGGEQFSWGMLLPLLMVAMYSAFQILTSTMAKTEDAATMHFYTGWVGTLVASLALPFVWHVPENRAQWVGLALMGALGTTGHYALIQAYRRLQAATMTPLLYFQIAFALLGGWLVFDHLPDGWSQIGIALIAVCGAVGGWLAVRESRLRVEPLEV